VTGIIAYATMPAELSEERMNEPRLLQLFLLAIAATIVFHPAAQAAQGKAAIDLEKLDWRWVHGAVFVPTNCVNEAQQWDQYDPAINDRELHCASIYGINLVRTFLHYDIYLKNKPALLEHIDDYLARADKYGIKVDFVFFDDCWNQPPRDILKADYQYPAPIFGVHNSRWLVSPGADVQSHYAEHRDRLKAYVQDIVNAHKTDPRIALFETYNEPNKSAETTRLGTDALAWIKQTGCEIPVTATGTDSAGDPYAEFKSWHTYDPTDRLRIKQDPTTALCTECMQRQTESVPAIVKAFKGKTGFVIWEFGIGRDNCRFAWDQNGGHPATTENAKPFHGMVYPDGHPWSVDDVKALMGEEAFVKTPLFAVEYFKDDHFTQSVKKSVTPFIDFDLKDERGNGSPDASVRIPKDHYSIRWTGTFDAPASGPFTFHIDSDQPARLTIDDKPVIDRQDFGGGDVSGVSQLEKGAPSKVVVEYAHATGDTHMHVTYEGPGMARRVLMCSSHPDGY
jgi:hypothetical protein